MKITPLFRSIFSLVLAVSLFANMSTMAAEDESTASASRLSIDDLFKLGDVTDPQISPEGEWIAYTVSRVDLDKEETRSRIWVVPAVGGEPIAMTAADVSSSHPRWSADGKYLAFLSARDEGQTQVWRLFRKGGEAEQLTETAQSVNSFAWSPDSSSLLLVLQDPTEQEENAKEQGEAYEDETPPPWVIDRQQFKVDYVGYLDNRRTHLYLLELDSTDIVQLTSGDFDDSEPVWSPDGKHVAFTSNRSKNPDSNYNTDVWVVSADPALAPAALTRVSSSPGPDGSPAWSPDGKFITHTSITGVEAVVYATSHLAISSARGGNTRVLTAELDRMIFQPRFSPDGRAVWFLLEDSGEQNLASIATRGGKIKRMIRGENVVSDFEFGPGGLAVTVISRPHLPAEVFSLRRGKLQQRTFTNQKLLAGLELGEVERVRYPSKDGTQIEGFVIKPPGFMRGQRYPGILDIHGGPQSQYDYSFSFEAQLYAAQGYLVMHPNPRGSTGYGQAFCLAIWRDWGGPDFEDVMAAVDDAITRGWVDAERLGVVGWSYGGILTNHVITRTDRFKAAITGASEALYVVNYGHDQYQRWWEQELGLPWEAESRARYERISPFNKVEQVVTPTLILGGKEDWNVPIINSEQLFLALKRLGVETQLVVYPGEHHGIALPTYQKDLYERYLDWFSRFL